MTASCRSCGAPIIWAKTEKGKAMPLDAEPAQTGTLWLFAGVVQTGDQPPAVNGPTYTSHFATCPQAGKWRKK